MQIGGGAAGLHDADHRRQAGTRQEPLQHFLLSAEALVDAAVMDRTELHTLILQQQGIHGE